MNAVSEADRAALRESVASLLNRRSSEAEVRRLMETEHGYDTATWRQMADQLGLQGLIIPDSYGGSGFTFAELGVVFEEMGKALYCGPFLATVLASAALLECEETLRKEHLPRIAAGELIATVAVEPWLAGGGFSPTVSAAYSGSGWQLDGQADFVLSGLHAELIVVLAGVEGKPALFAVSGDSANLARTPLDTTDRTRKQARLDFTAVPAALIAEGTRATEIAQRICVIGAVALAAEQAGGIAEVLRMAVSYAQTREQFGRAIGSFQAVKHTCADMLVLATSAAAVARKAAAAVSADFGDLRVLAGVAKSYCSEAFIEAAADNIQVHGGIGFTWEHPAHLYLRRAMTSNVMFGDAGHHRELLAGQLGV